MDTFVALMPVLAGLLTAVGAWFKARAETRALLAKLAQAETGTQRLARKDDLDELRAVLDEVQEDRAMLRAQSHPPRRGGVDAPLKNPQRQRLGF